MITRRSFVRALAAMASALLVPLARLAGPSVTAVQAEDPEVGELYAGFVLLEEGASVPAFVALAPCPILGEIASPCDSDPTTLANRGETSWFESIEDLRANVGFPLFMPGSLPKGITYLQGTVVRFAGSGQVWQARIDFGLSDTLETLVSLVASPVFHRPYPVWPVLGCPKESEGTLNKEYFQIRPQKVAFTPHQGIMLPHDQGYMLQWLKHDVMYTMFMEYEGWREAAESVGRSLVER